MARAWLCDFDGTVSPTDIGAAFVERFTRERGRFDDALGRWRAGEIGHRDLTLAELAGVRVSPEEALEFSRGFALDPHFGGFVRDAVGRGEHVEVASEGFDFYVRDQLARAGLGHLPFTANRLRFADGGVVPEFASPAGGCGRCGNCKGAHVRRCRADGAEVVVVGDGLSDRCGARAADRVIARGDLLDWCRREQLAATPFADFADVARHAITGAGA